MKQDFGCALLCRFKKTFHNFSIQDLNRTYISLVCRIGMKILSTYTTAVRWGYSTMYYARYTLLSFYMRCTVFTSCISYAIFLRVLAELCRKKN